MKTESFHQYLFKYKTSTYTLISPTTFFKLYVDNKICIQIQQIQYVFFLVILRPTKLAPKSHFVYRPRMVGIYLIFLLQNMK